MLRDQGIDYYRQDFDMDLPPVFEVELWAPE
jgi:hypothetical protein